MKAVDLFCGCGGLSLGFLQAGYDILAAYDNWDDAISIYKANFQHPVFKQDLSNVDDSVQQISGYAPDIIIGGPPCQDYSSAGKQDEDNGRGALTVSYAEIIAKIKPKWFVMENVERILKSNKLQIAKECYKNAGYGLSQALLNASLCGVPQNRLRFFLIGHLGDKDNFLDDELTSGMASKPMTLKDYFGDKLGVEYYYRHPRNYNRRAIFSIYEPSPTIRGTNCDIPPTYKLHPNDPVTSLDGIRGLTTKERSLIQTFPDNFVWMGSKTKKEQIIGNAVPVKLGEFVAKAILDYSKNHQ